MPTQSLSIVSPAMNRPALSSDCASGHHQPRRSSVQGDGGTRRATCRWCNCDLLQMGTSRKWIRSGYMG